ncbi:MAG: mycofactocin biosynthesis glycosyltransferase MftF [SAR324 cluster bacterium]|nr:mycofactocin biosynthesis glycosyltransferase MftF [SAR324 cluster bacterium]
MLHRCYGLVPGAKLEQIAGRWLLAADYPLRQFEVNESARRLLQALDGRTPLHEIVEDPSRELVRFLEDKVIAGLLHVSYSVEPLQQWPSVEVIVPVYENLEGLKRCLDGLAGLKYPRQRYSVTVVDDGSSFSILDALRGVDFAGLTTSWRHLNKNYGPATARNAGAGIFESAMPNRFGRAAQPSQVLAFLDSDCVAHADWLETLVGVLDDPLLDAVGGRVEGLRKDSLLARYEDGCASLNMGGRGGAAGLPGDAIPYLPACNLLVKRAAFDAVKGFQHGLRLGEDVDLCWRLASAGHGLFYYAGGTVYHDYRVQWSPFLNRKRQYASSEAWLRRRHPDHYRRRGNWWGAVLLLCAGWAVQTGQALALTPVPLLPPAAAMLRLWRSRKVLRATTFRKAAAAGLRAELASLLAQARSLTRHSLLLWFPLLVAFPRLLSVAGIVFLMAVCAEWRARRPNCGFFTFLAGFTSECAAYSLGRLQGEARAWWRRMLGGEP